MKITLNSASKFITLEPSRRHYSGLLLNKGPIFYRVHDYLLNKLVEDVKNKVIEGYLEIWKQTRCTIMANGWTDRCR